MSEDKYQITTKAQYLNLLLLKDELQYFDQLLAETESWLSKLRATRGVFLTLNNVKDAADRIQINGSSEFVIKTRSLRKNLIFANYFRNRGIGHLNVILLKRAAQWSPQVFHELFKKNDEFKLVEAQRAIIESCINSYIDKDGNQKIFDTEIDLLYPPDAKQFYTYLAILVEESIDWLIEATNIILEKIEHHTDEDVRELASIAGQTNFDLKAESEFSYSIEEYKLNSSKVITALEQQGTDPKLLDFIKEKLEI